MITIDAATVQRVDAWLDEPHGPYGGAQLAQHWARIAKLAEEAGEADETLEALRFAQLQARVSRLARGAGKAINALGAWTGENPRKGVHGTLEDLKRELADVVLGGILALEHLTKDTAETQRVLDAKVQALAERVPDRT